MDEEPKISAVVITLNEEKNIAGCLESLAWADEIVVLDSRSTDRTVEIARKYTDKVFVEAWKGQGPHKNRSVELAQGPWIFSIDADERVTPELAGEIRKAVNEGAYDVFAVRRKNIYRGRWVKHGGWWPDWVTRLFVKGKARFNDVIVHDSLQTECKVGKLDNALEHYSYHSAIEFVVKSRRFIESTAILRFQKGRKISWLGVMVHTLWCFFHGYVLRGGFLDGGAGLLVACSRALGVFYRYALLIEMNEDAAKAREPAPKHDGTRSGQN